MKPGICGVLCGMVFTLPVFASFSGAADLAAVQKAIRESGAAWQAGATSVSRLPPDKQAALAGLEEAGFDFDAPVFMSENKSTPPADVDWRNSVTPVKMQVGPYCWAYAATAALESYAMRTQGVRGDLSVQALISCSGATDKTYNKAYDYIKSTGLPPASFPANCAYDRSGWQGQARKIRGWSFIKKPDVNALKAALAQYGPLATGMRLYNDFQQYYRGGVYSLTAGAAPVGGHAVLVVGYNDAGQYFIGKNSYGTGWGEAGFFRIAYSEVKSPVRFGEYTVVYR
ncbi:MAG: C1 family peptidase [Elusimicrobiales bacterium]|nr:C1 family peptidase [Elusimicrobiales bacterium]